MIDNTMLLQECMTHGVIRLHDADVLHSTPSPLPPDFDFQKVEGMLLGLAIGDALGAPTEGMLPGERHARYGEIRDFLPSRNPDMEAIGAVTDDTQLACWTLEQLVTDGGLVPEHLADKFCSGHINGIGNTVGQFIRRHKDQGLPWQLAAIDSLGNGALMRIAPVVVPHLQMPHASLYADAALDAMVTHNSYGNIATCIAFVDILWQLLGMRRAPSSDWWTETFVSSARELEGETAYAPDMPGVADYKGPLWRFAELMCHSALQRRTPVLDACNHWGSGASLLGTVPSVLHILAMYGHDPEAAIIRAVNDTKDNDTVAAIVGAAVGALHGLAGLPERWLEGLSGQVLCGWPFRRLPPHFPGQAGLLAEALPGVPLRRQRPVETPLGHSRACDEARHRAGVSPQGGPHLGRQTQNAERRTPGPSPVSPPATPPSRSERVRCCRPGSDSAPAPHG